MPAIAILTAAGVASTFDGEGRLLDLVDERGAGVPFSCRSARCATCLVDVLAGAELLDPPGDDERLALASHAATPTQRLACQVRVRGGAGLVRLRVVGTESPSR